MFNETTRKLHLCRSFNSQRAGRHLRSRTVFDRRRPVVRSQPQGISRFDPSTLLSIVCELLQTEREVTKCPDGGSLVQITATVGAHISLLFMSSVPKLLRFLRAGGLQRHRRNGGSQPRKRTMVRKSTEEASALYLESLCCKISV